MSKTQNSPCDPGISPTEFFNGKKEDGKIWRTPIGDGYEIVQYPHQRRKTKEQQIKELRKMHEIDLLTDLIEHLRNEPGELYSRGEIIRWLRVVRRKTKNNQR